nr:hypothetical protein [Leptospira noguchii]
MEFFNNSIATRTYEDSTKLLTTEFGKKIAVFKKCCKFAIYGILEEDQNIQIFETINPSILFMCPSSYIYKL